MQVARPTAAEYDQFYETYINLIPEGNLLTTLETQSRIIQALARMVPANGGLEAYAPGKWMVREVLGHLVDAERVFGLRAYRISRNDQTDLPGFDENQFVENSEFRRTRVATLAREFGFVRAGNLLFLARLDEERWKRTGSANGTRVSVRAIAYIMAGHVQHHLNILKERYRLQIPDWS